jgi:hypothetical protein
MQPKKLLSRALPKRAEKPKQKPVIIDLGNWGLYREEKAQRS